MTTFDASGLPDLPRQTLRELQAELGDFLLVGMGAVDLVARGLADLPATRLTRDVDVAVAVDSHEELQELTKRLVQRGDSSLHYWLGDAQVDVVPYGDLAPHDLLMIDDTSLDVSGLSAAARSSLSIRVDEELVVRVASLASLVALKLIAWTDRGAETENKDALDVQLLLRASTSGRFNRELWSDDDALEKTDYDPERAGPYRVGRQIAGDFEPSFVARLQTILVGVSGQRLREIGRGPLTSDYLDALLLGLGQPTRPTD